MNSFHLLALQNPFLLLEAFFKQSDETQSNGQFMQNVTIKNAKHPPL